MRLIFLFSLTSILFLTGCSKLILVQEPEMRVLGGKTLIEAQVLGRYRQIDESAYQISTLSSDKELSLLTVSTNVTDELGEEYRRALIRSMFNEDEIYSYKASYYIGENNIGYLSYIAFDIAQPSTRYGADRIKYILSLIEQENKDRRVIAEYLIMSDGRLTMANIREVENALYRRNIERLKNNTWYQLPDNTWNLLTNAN